MCRIFGFRSILQSGVHRSLLDSDNAIIQQSHRHPDGWGVAYYHMDTPHLIKNDNQAQECKIFEKVSAVVSSNTVITHIRKSTVGMVGPLNTHPFQFGPWVFAHNGNIQNFAEKKAGLRQAIDPELSRFILGDTDSEHLFYLFLTILKQKGQLNLKTDSFQFSEVLPIFVDRFQELCGPLSESKGDYDKNYLTFVITNGQNLYAFHGGQTLYFSTHKQRCSERDRCQSFKDTCERRAHRGEKVHHLLISSEVINNENQWQPLAFGDYVGVDENYKLKMGQVNFS